MSGRALLTIFARDDHDRAAAHVRPPRLPLVRAGADAERAVRHPGAPRPIRGPSGSAPGLVGAGGAFLLVPVLIALLRVPVRLSIGTSLAMTASPPRWDSSARPSPRQVPLWPAVAVIFGSFLGAPLGARVSRRVPVVVLRVVLVVVITLVAIGVWVDVLRR